MIFLTIPIAPFLAIESRSQCGEAQGIDRNIQVAHVRMYNGGEYALVIVGCMVNMCASANINPAYVRHRTESIAAESDS